MVIMAVTDKKNGPPPAGLVPLALFMTLLGISASLGMETSFAVNPARDFGPRIFTAMVYGKQVFTFREYVTSVSSSHHDPAYTHSQANTGCGAPLSLHFLAVWLAL